MIGGFVSGELSVLSGVPQGSFLGPTLFVLFLNDIVQGLDPATNVTMYADDTKIWSNMFDWAIRNKMRFHP